MRSEAQRAGGAGAHWALVSPSGVGAIAVIEVTGDVDSALTACGIQGVAVGQVVLRDLFGVDKGLIARYTPWCAHVMPHGGAAVVRGVVTGLERAGIQPKVEAQAAYPESRSPAEARALSVLAHAASPRAVDAILSRIDTWDGDAEQRLRHLLTPPLVVAVGRPNIGKSSLVNALAKRCVSIVADEPGTTRDHVGVRLDLGGLVVHYVDTPGLREDAEDPLEAHAQRIAVEVAGRADLLLVCRDAATDFPLLPPEVSSRLTLLVGLRADLGTCAGPGVWVSARDGRNLEGLVTHVQAGLVPGLVD